MGKADSMGRGYLYPDSFKRRRTRRSDSEGTAPGKCRQFRIEKATRLTIIGQLKEQADLVLPSTAVSRVHASIEQRAGNWYLKDMNSRNGTWVNEQELYGEEEQELINGDQIRFADLIYQVKI